MRTATIVTFWPAMIIMGTGMIFFWYACTKVKKSRVTKMALLLTVLCLGLGAVMTYLFVEYLGLMTIFFSLLIIWYGISIWIMGYQFLKPKRIQKKFMIHPDDEKNQTALFYVEYIKTNNSDNSMLKLSLQVDKDHLKVVNFEMAEREPNSSFEKIKRKTVSPNCCLAIERIVEQNKLLKWVGESETVGSEKNDVVTSLKLWYLDGGRYSIPDINVASAEDADQFEDIGKCILEYAGIKRKSEK